MKVTDVRAAYPEYSHVAASWRTNLWQIVVKIETDAGITGYGYGGGGKASVEVINGHLRELVEGTPVDSRADIQDIWDRLYRESIPYGRKGIAPMAISGIDLALWDALGKAENVPVARLLSDRPRERMQCYATGPDTEWHVARGYTASKRPHRWNGDPAEYDHLAAWAENSRKLLGPTGRLMIDTYMSWDYATTIEMSRNLASADVYWFEDVMTPDDLAAQASLREEIGNINLAGGEHEFTQHGFRDLLRSGALDIWQPDTTWCGGITAALRILDVARGEAIPVVPHRGAEVWGLHLIAATECQDFAEYVTGPKDSQNDDIWIGAPEPSEGFISVSDAPGFGVELNENSL